MEHRTSFGERTVGELIREDLADIKRAVATLERLVKANTPMEILQAMNYESEPVDTTRY